VFLDIGYTLATAGSGQNVPTLIGVDTPQIITIPDGSTLPSQATVDALLGTPNDIIVATAFGATAMVADNTYGFILACSGQIAELGAVQAFLNIGGTVSLSVGVGTTTALTNAAFTLTQAYLSPAGNLAVRITATGISLRTNAGSLVFRIAIKSK
jgi:hypothetical protein